MGFPEFFRRIPRLQVHDPLAALLGAPADGMFDYGFEDAVRLSGHACPTVAMAYALTVKGVLALCGADTPQRGSFGARFPSPLGEGTTGVVASIVTLLTGAAGEGGFKGLGGQHVRRARLAFEFADEPGFVLMRDDGPAVHLQARLERVPPDPQLTATLRACLAGGDEAGQRDRLAHLWQRRIEQLLVAHWDDGEVWQVRAA